MNTFRLFLAAALSFMLVYANESGRDDESPENYNQCSGLAPPLQMDKIDPIEKKDYEKFKEYKGAKDWGKIKPYEQLLKHTAKAEKHETSEKFREDNFCSEKQKIKKSCRTGYTCINVSSGKSGEASRRRPKCLRPCSYVCSRKCLRCGGFLEDPPTYPIWWWKAMNQKCWQVERRGPVVLKPSPYPPVRPSPYFMRTTCRCPTRDYTYSDGCDTTGAAASLSNCIEGYLQLGAEINFHDLRNVQFGIVKTTNPANGDIDFQGHISRSMFCKIDAAEDVEFGGGNSSCSADLRNNVFFDVEMVDDVQFEEGTTLDNNIFFNLKANDDFKFQKDDDGVFPTIIQNNYFREVVVEDECSIESGFSLAGLSIVNNGCNSFDENDDDFCTTNTAISGGFTCLPP